MLDLQVLWDDLARRHKSTPGQPKPSGFQLFNRVADELARTLPQTGAEALRELDQLQGSFSGSPAICTGCGAGESAALLHVEGGRRDALRDLLPGAKG